MLASRSMRLVQTALRCYPQRWRSRHGAEAAELARLLMQDGTPARSIAWSYFKGAASTRLLQPRGRLAAVGALLAAACSLGLSLALLSASAPASAANHWPSHEGRHCVAGSARSSAPTSIRVGADKTVGNSAMSGRGQHC